MTATAVSVGVAQAVAAALAAADLSQDFTPERSYANWELELENADCLRVDVVAVIDKQTCVLFTRGKKRYTIPVDIAVRKRFAPNEQDDETGRIDIAELDALCLLTEEIHGLFMKESLDGFDSAVWDRTEISVSPVTDHLKKFRQFTSIVRIPFVVDKAV